MNAIRSVRALLLAATLLCALPALSSAGIMLTSMVNKPQFAVLHTANFTIDDWLSNPNLWSVTVTWNQEQPAVDLRRMDIEYQLWSSEYNPIVRGTAYLYDRYSSGHQTLFDAMQPGVPYLIYNTMIREGSGYVTADDWSEEFLDEVLRIGYLPEGEYFLKFTVYASYTDGSSEQTSTGDDEVILEIRNPAPPELMTPDDGSTDVVAIPRFTWQRPTANTFTIGDTRTMVPMFYTFRLWKMFEESGEILTEEEAITRIPIWEVTDHPFESIDFNPGDSREELISGRQYCWQVQAFDGEGRYITETNQGRSEVWEFTVQFTPPELYEPVAFMPLTVTWQPARAAGIPVFYRVRLADNPDYTGAYTVRNLIGSRFSYPFDAPALQHGQRYYIEVQAMDVDQVPLGTPSRRNFVLPPLSAAAVSPADGETLPTFNPLLTWSGTAQYYTVTMYDETSDWLFTSSAIEGMQLLYDGDPLRPGTTYAWTVTPANRFGDPIGDPSDSRRFTTPGEGQVALRTPVNTSEDTVYPVFTWDRPDGVPTDASFTIQVYDFDGALIHEGTTSETRYEYPREAPVLTYASRYTWTVIPDAGGTQSGQAWFLTPFVTPEGEMVTMDDISRALLMVMGDSPEFRDFEGMILAGIRDENGPLTPNELMMIMNRYRLINVTVQ